MKAIGLAVALLALSPAVSFAQTYIRVPTCGGATPPAGSSQGYMDPAGNICTSTSGTLTLVPLDASSVVTGGTAVTALTAGHRNKGGWIQNPAGAAAALCINESGTASGTVSSGATTCIQAGQSYTLAPSGNAVSVISSDSSHTFSGQGFN